MEVSVVLYVHNGGDYLPLAIESILAQTHTNLELCVVDDGSTDETPLVLADAAARDQRVRVREQGWLGSDGLHETFNNALAMTRHDLIAIANADDIWLPHKLERQLEAFAADPDLDICYHDATFIDHAGRVAHGSFRSVPSRNPAPPVRPWQFIGGNPVPNPTVVFHRSVLRRIGLQEVGQMHDYQFWFKAAIHGCRFLGIADRLIRYRVHEGSESTATAKKARIIELHRECAREMLTRHGLDGLFPELAACGTDADSRAWAWSHVAAMFWKRDGITDAAAAWSEALRLSDDPAILCNLAAAALREGNHRQARALLTQAGQTGYERAGVLARQPDLADVLTPELWAGPTPALARLVEQSVAPDSPPPVPPRLAPAEVCLTVDELDADDGAVADALHRLSIERGCTPTPIVIVTTSDRTLAAVVNGYERLEVGAPDIAASLDVDVLRVHPDEVAGIERAHLLDGAAVLSMHDAAATVPELALTPA